jgi:hypothetical protein
VLEETESDLRDLALVLARAVTDAGGRTSIDDVLQAFGQTRESLEERAPAPVLDRPAEGTDKLSDAVAAMREEERW